MSTFLAQALRALLSGLVISGAALGLTNAALAQAGAPSVKFQVRGPAEQLEMTVNTSRVLEFDFEVPKMLVNNPDLVRVVPIAPKSIQISALKSGVTQLNVWDSDGNVTSVDVSIIADIEELKMILKTLFPDAALTLRPLNSSLYISGFVPKQEQVSQIAAVAKDYFPNIINNMSVGGVQKVLLYVKVLEVSRTKLRAFGFDWAELNGASFITQSSSGLLQAPGILTGNTGATYRFGIVNGNNQFFGFLEALRQNDLAKLMAEPTLTTLSGRPASFNVGGQVPIPLQQALGVTTVQYREFGTQIDFVPIVLGNGSIRLEVRPEITEIDPSLRDAVTGVPGFRTRRADTAVEMKAGQTMAIAGLVYNRLESTNRGTPWLSDLPWAGAAFRHVQQKVNEVELVILVRPEFADAMEPCDVPRCGPGQTTVPPTDVELYWRGYLEVPNTNCGPGGYQPGHNMAPGYGPGPNQGYEVLPAPDGVPPAAPPAPVVDPQARMRTGQPTRAQPANYSSVRMAQSPRPAAAPAPQNPNSYYSPSATGQNSGASVQPALIGPLGYDDLK
jgi:pilus assembly protein CpaC